MAAKRGATEIRRDVAAVQNRLTDADEAFREAILFLLDEVEALKGKPKATAKKTKKGTAAK